MLDMMYADEEHEREAELALHREKEGRGAVRRLTVALFLSAVLLLALNSERLVTWVNGFEVGLVQDAVVTLSTEWHALMVEAGLSAPTQALRSEVNDLRATDWGEVRRWIERERARTQEGARLLRGAIADARS